MTCSVALPRSCRRVACLRSHDAEGVDGIRSDRGQRSVLVPSWVGVRAVAAGAPMKTILAAAIIGYVSFASATAQVRQRDDRWDAPSNAAARRNPLADRLDAAACGA